MKKPEWLGEIIEFFYEIDIIEIALLAGCLSVAVAWIIPSIMDWF